MEMTVQQNSVFERIERFMSGGAQVFILRGYAGTGKTTMVKVIADYVSQLREVMLMAPTGRAARVLGEKTGRCALTIHRAIYGKPYVKAEEVDDVADSRFCLSFPIASYDFPIVAIVDEASMLASQTVEQEVYQFGTGNLMADLLTFVRPDSGGKVIFVGDPAQLPPVSENSSNALDAAFFARLGLKVEEAELTEVLRQGEGSAVLQNAMLIRELLKSDKRNHLALKEREGEVVSLAAGEFLNRFIEEKQRDCSESPVIISFLNRSAYDYNKEVRQRLYGEENPALRAGDVLQVVNNNYKLDYMNGDFVNVLSVGEVEHFSAPVYVQEGGVRVKKIMNLDFQNVIVQSNDGNPCSCLLYLNLLNSGAASMSINEQRALFINFCMRNPSLKRNSTGFVSAILEDKYYNCLKAKYGYAVTGHKCQGGEWAKVFVDYSGRTGLGDDCLRWAYTATTRAKDTLYFTNFPHITPFAKFRIESVQKCVSINEEFRVLKDVEHTPFHNADTPVFLRAKYHCIVRNMEWTQYRVHRVESKQYQEVYYIETPDGIVVYDIRYKKGGLFSKAVPRTLSEHDALLKIMLNDETAMPLVFDYVPSDDINEKLFSLVSSACDDAAVSITNIVEHREDYSVMYYLYTSGTYSYIKFYIDKNGFVTYAKPMSVGGNEDGKLKALIEEIQKYFV